VALEAFASVAVTAKLDVPALPLGEPLIAPAELRDKPTGKLPLLTEKVYGDVPPPAVRFCE
jgi:hypothetical protein